MRNLIMLLVALSLLPVSCTFGRLKKQTEQLRGQWVLMSQVSYEAEPTGDLVAVAYEITAEGASVVAFRIVSWNLKEFVFLLDPGDHDYRAAVFHDANRNRVIDDGEQVLLAAGGNRIRFSDVSTWKMVKTLPAEAPALPDDYPRDLSKLPAESEQSFYIALGAVADLKDEKFSQEASRLGFWEPYAFMRRHGVGVYTLEPHDPTKIPVLFVSGAGGNIDNWDYFLQRLDRTRYQPWYFLYPSGMRIPRAGLVLHLLFQAAEKTHDVDEVVVIAHSMGGLVAREFIRNHIKSECHTRLTHFVTISTPWNGDRMATDGVNMLTTPISKPIPSWHDLSPGSRFLQGAFAEPIGPHIDHYLLFSHMPETDGDGVVALTSQLLPEAQDDAIALRGYQAGHMEILFLDEVFEYVMGKIAVKKPGNEPEKLEPPASPEPEPTAP